MLFQLHPIISQLTSVEATHPSSTRSMETKIYPPKKKRQSTEDAHGASLMVLASLGAPGAIDPRDTACPRGRPRHRVNL